MLILDVATAYLWIGGAVAVAFVLRGVDRVDPAARGAWTFRPLIVPGAILLWPLVLWRWIALARGTDPGGRRHRPPRRAQDRLALLLAVAIPVLIAAALLVRQDGPLERAAVRLAPPAAEARP